MKLHILAVTALALFLGLGVMPPGLYAQSPEAAQKLEKIAKELKLTPQQKLQFLPILQSEMPQVQAIKSNPSLSGIQKIQQLRAVHAQTDPQVRSILSPQQYEKLQQIREKEIQQMIKKKMGS